MLNYATKWLILPPQDATNSNGVRFNCDPLFYRGVSGCQAEKRKRRRRRGSRRSSSSSSSSPTPTSGRSRRHSPDVFSRRDDRWSSSGYDNSDGSQMVEMSDSCSDFSDNQTDIDAASPISQPPRSSHHTHGKRPPPSL